HHALAANLLRREQVHAELAEVVAGRRPGRTREDEITIFDSSGTALQDVAAAVAVYEKARAAGRGTALNLEGQQMPRIRASFLKIGLTEYGGPAIIGVMQAEFQERRQWIGKPQFVEGLAFVNMLPGATATQLGIFLGHQRAGWLGGLLAGLGFCAPAFAIMLALTLAYAALGVSPWLRGALYGLGPIVLAVFGVAVYRLGNTALRSRTHVLIALSAAAAALFAPGATVWIMLCAGSLGLFLFYRRSIGVVAVLAVALVMVAARVVAWTPRFMTPAPGAVPS